MSEDPHHEEPTSDGATADPRWQRIEAVFEQALERADAEREAYLATACAEDADLRREVDSLIAAHGKATGFFGRLADEVVHPAFQQAGGLPPGTPVGPYEIVRLVGRGGMGEVYEARRGDGAFDQTVALKLVPRSGSAAVLRRFEAERQILAGLDHPHIARLLDGGLSGEGRPYFAMEFVRGLPITAYCDRHRLGIDARLALFRTVCAAVQHAHRRLVVHRDLKPSNILVAEDEAGQPVVKLLDFGIAKLLDVAPDVSVLETQTGLRLMTPEYAAPEQVRGDAITTATDVYALGVLLYELLTGHRPYRLAERLPHEVERVILEDDPVRPSTAITEVETRATAAGTETRGPATVSEARATEAGRLRRRLAGDLDRICLMALRKEPDRRYGSATDLAEDVRRHLDGLPVAAQPDTLGYRARKFVRRNRVGVGAVGAVVLALVVGLGAALWQARVAAAERDRAQLEAETSQQVTDFFVRLLEAEDPRAAQGDTVTVRQVLDAGVERIGTDLTDQPGVQARLYLTTGEVYRSLGDMDRARDLLERGLSLADSVFAGDPLARAEAQDQVARWHASSGSIATADSLAQQALVSARQVHRGDHQRIAELLDLHAGILRERERFAAADSLEQEAIAMARRVGLDPSLDLAIYYNNLALSYHEQGRRLEAAPLYRQAVDMMVAAEGEGHPYVATMRHNLAGLYRGMLLLEESEELYRTMLAHERRLYPGDHPNLAAALSNLGLTLKERGRYAECLALQDSAVAMMTRVYGEDHPNTLYRERIRVLALNQAARWTEGEAGARALLARLQAMGAMQSNTARVSFRALGEALRGQGRYDEALAVHEQMRDAYAQRYPEGHPAYAQAHIETGYTYAAMSRWADTEQEYRAAIDYLRKSYGTEGSQYASGQVSLATALREQGRYGEAGALLDSAAAVFAATYAEGNLFEASRRTQASRLALAQGDASEALTLAEQGLSAQQAVRGEAHPAVIEAHGALGDALASAGQTAAARDHLERYARGLRNRQDPRAAQAEAALASL
ncbi:MAG: tetratricopeptide repeat protein [Bacteroidota bacterium]